MKGMGLLDGCRDGTAAQDDVAAVDNDCLAGGDGSLRFVKSQQHLPVGATCKGRCLVLLTVAVLGAHANAAGIELSSMRSAGALQIQSLAVSTVAARSSASPRCTVLLERRRRYVHGMRHRDAQALALADGIAQRAVVASDHAAVAPHNVARCSGMSAAALDIARVVAVRDKADILAFGLLGVDEACSSAIRRTSCSLSRPASGKIVCDSRSCVSEYKK